MNKFVHACPEKCQYCSTFKEDKFLATPWTSFLWKDRSEDREMYIIPLMNTVEFIQELQIIETYEEDRAPLLRHLQLGRNTNVEINEERLYPQEISELMQSKYNSKDALRLWDLYENIAEQNLLLRESKCQN